jgi:hypothetical protein
MSPIIDDAGARAISGWFKEKADVPHTITILADKLPLMLNVDNDTDKAKLVMILMRNGVNHIVDDINNISKN